MKATLDYDMSSTLACPRWTDGFQLFEHVIYEPGLAVIIDVRSGESCSRACFLEFRDILKQFCGSRSHTKYGPGCYPAGVRCAKAVIPTHLDRQAPCHTAVGFPIPIPLTSARSPSSMQAAHPHNGRELSRRMDLPPRLRKDRRVRRLRDLPPPSVPGK